MKKNTTEGFACPGSIEDSLTDLLRTGAKRLIQGAIELELQALLKNYSKVTDLSGRQTVVRNGYLPEREILTGIGPVKVQVPKVRDRSGNGVKFNSALVPPYIRKAKSIEAALPWLYLKGISTGDMQEALAVGCRNNPLFQIILFPLFGLRFSRKKLGVSFLPYRGYLPAPIFPNHCDGLGLALG